MFAAALPDLDSLDLEAAKALLIAQHKRYTATLTSRASEIERLVLLVEKLQRMLFGAKSEKVLRQIEQLEFQLEPPVPSRKRRRFLPQSVPHRRSPSAAPCPSIFSAKSTRTCPAMRRAPTAVEGCASWGKM
jgi:hypothetical protein